MNVRGGSIRVMHPLFQEGEGGSTPTPPLSAKALTVEVIEFSQAKRLNALWHSRFPRFTSPQARLSLAACCGGGVAYAVAIWGRPIARMLPQYTCLELRRMAVAPDAPKNTASRMLRVMAVLIRRRLPEITRLVSYQDTEVHSGTIYKAAGWKVAATCKFSSWTRASRKRRAVQSHAAKQRWDLELAG